MSDFKTKMYQIQFWLGLRPRVPAGRAYVAPPDLLAGLRGPTSKGREGEGRGRQGEGSLGDETAPLHAPLIHISGYAPVSFTCAR